MRREPGFILLVSEGSVAFFKPFTMYLVLFADAVTIKTDAVSLLNIKDING